MSAKISRTGIIKLVFALLLSVVVLRLFQLQVFQYDYYSVIASKSHNRKFEIAPKRGKIFLQDRGAITSVAMNRNRKSLYADMRYINDKAEAVRKLKQITGNDYAKKLETKDSYVVLEPVLSYEVAQKIADLELSGIGLSDNYVREYPEDSLAAQVLGFVNADGLGQYGVEGSLDEQLKGIPGLFNAKTDTKGIPIATSENIQVQPIDGDDVVLTIDRNIQAYVESALKRGVEETGAKSAHAVIMDPSSGRILSIANYPTFDPNKYNQVSDYRRFVNVATSEQFEPGSGFKLFTIAAGLEAGVITPTDTFNDTGSVDVAGTNISNAEPAGGVRTITDIITYSVNTGVVYVLTRLGGETQINSKAKETLYDFFVNRFRLTDPTGIAQTGEPILSMNRPNEVGPVNYANMTFGQGITTTMIRMITSMSAIINGGTLYAPQLVDYTIAASGAVTDKQPEVIAKNVISAQTSSQIRMMMETVLERGGGYSVRQQNPGYRIGGKTGTAQIPNPDGGYYLNRDIGTFTGFAPLENPKYIMIVRVDQPTNGGFAGSAAAGPIFGDILQWLLKYGGVAPQSR